MNEFAVRTILVHRDLDDWRAAVRPLLREGVPPSEVFWDEDDADRARLFASAGQEPVGPPASGEGDQPLSVPADFFELARAVLHHRDAGRWELLYRVAFRIARGGERHLLEIASDDDVARLQAMERAVRRDRHKMTAFVRFRRVVEADGGERYVAWHRPEHFVLPLAADHFVSRFGGAMRFAILTPDESLVWNGRVAEFGAGVPRSAAPREDDLEALWLTYYSSTFNPARIKLRQMRKEMPVRHWATLPETAAIPSLLSEARMRVHAMIRQPREEEAERKKLGIGTSAAEFLPADGERAPLSGLADAAKACRGCPLFLPATQTVFGEGPPKASVVFVGEQPGDEEDRAGRPFVGPAGRLLGEVLEELGIDRRAAYVTNAVKHFKFTPRGKRRIHVSPSVREVKACQPWLEAELRAIRPPMLVCLGATAAKAVAGPAARVTTDRGRPFATPWCDWTLITTHPSALLRMPDADARAAARAAFTADLKLVADRLSSLPGQGGATARRG